MKHSKIGFLSMSHDVYASMIGLIIHVMLCTRDDILYILSIYRRYQLDLGEFH